MTIDAKTYFGWQLDSISLDGQLFIVNLARYSLPVAAAKNLASQPVRAMIIFLLRKGVVLSKVRWGDEIDEIKQSSDEQGNVQCILKFSSDSFIKVTAGGVTDLLF